MGKKEAIASIKSIDRRCRGTLPPEIRAKITMLLANNLREEASALDKQHRSGCGYDFNNILIKKEYWDGIEHSYRCPSCGNTGYFTITPFEGLED